MPLFFISKIGACCFRFFYLVGDSSRFLYKAMRALFKKQVTSASLFLYMKQIGIDSLVIIILTGIFTGTALAFQAYIGFSKFGTEGLIGGIVAMGMTRELGPVLTGLMVIARAGSAMTAELGTMKITEQIDALKTLNINPYRYLVTPRIIASVLVMPCLTMFSAICGIAGGYIFCSYVLDLNPISYISSIRQLLDLSDIVVGLIKSSFFGFILAWVATYNGYRTSEGARGVGKATTQSVVSGSILVLIMNSVLSYILYQAGLG